MVVLQQPNILFYCQNNPIEGCASSYSHGKEAKHRLRLADCCISRNELFQAKKVQIWYPYFFSYRTPGMFLAAQGIGN